MTANEVGTIVLSVISLFISTVFGVYTFVQTRRLTRGQLEVQIREMISSAKARCLDLRIQLAREENDESVRILEQANNAAFEDLLNVYDEACAKYLDGKVDKESFKRLYNTEIKNLVEKLDAKWNSKIRFKYQTIMKVYKEWR